MTTPPTTTNLPSSPTPPSTASYILATFIVAICAGYYLGQASSIGLFSSSSSSSSKSNPSSSSASSSSSGKSGKSKPKRTEQDKSSWPNSYDVTVHPDTSDEELMSRLKGDGGMKAVRDSEEEDEDGSEEEEGGWGLGQEEGVKTFEGNREECKLVLVVRTDLGMGKGKIAAQCSHATLACYKSLLSSSSPSSPPNPRPHRPTANPLLRRWESTGQAKIALQVPTEHDLDVLYAKAQSVGLNAQVVQDAGRTQVVGGTRTVLGIGPGPRSVVDGVTGGLRLL